MKYWKHNNTEEIAALQVRPGLNWQEIKEREYISRKIPQEFKSQLQNLININSLENLLSMPDFIMAEMICDLLESVALAHLKNQNWHE